MKIKHWPYVLAVFLFAIFSCNKYENVPAPSLKIPYFPLKVSAVIIYNVDSTVYSDFNNAVTNYAFQLKDTVTNKFFDGLGEEAFRIERFKKIGDKDWTFQKIIIRKAVNNRAEEYLDNRRYVRLVTPLTMLSKWNGNLYNNLGEWPHEVIALDEPMTIGTNQLDSTVSIQQYDENNLIREDIYSEVYAKNIGLVKKQVRAVDKNISTGQIRRGFAYTMQVQRWK